MEKREQYKRLLLLLASAMILAAQTGIFVYVWYTSYGQIGANFFVRGNYIVIGQYALMVFFFNKLYGGFKIGQARVFEMVYSQAISVVCVNAIT
jgi:hypothetical protein